MTLPARIYECSGCYRRYVGDSPHDRCQWCNAKGTVVDIGTSASAPPTYEAWCHEYKAKVGKWPSELLERRHPPPKLPESRPYVAPERPAIDLAGLEERMKAYRDRLAPSKVKSAMLSATPSASKPISPPASKPAQNTPPKGGELR